MTGCRISFSRFKNPTSEIQSLSLMTARKSTSRSVEVWPLILIAAVNPDCDSPALLPNDGWWFTIYAKIPEMILAAESRGPIQGRIKSCALIRAVLPEP